MHVVRTRFAPSPTGFLHIGGLRTALYSYAFAKNQQGQFLLRIEDTDRKRFVPGATEKVYEILKVFGLSWDEGPLVGGPNAPYIQSERVSTGIYKQDAEKLVAENHAYYCFCDPQSNHDVEKLKRRVNVRDTNCRNLTKEEIEEKIKSGLTPAIRLRVPDRGTVEYVDFIIGKKISWETKDIDEAMLLKSDGFPTYHLAVVVDDSIMQITHIIRGHDWLPSTPIHLLLMDYLDFSRPEIGHLTDILDPEGGKLSKRKGSVSCEGFLAEGYLPEAILNFIMLLGWAPKDNRELFSLEEFVASFQQGSLQTANPVFNRAKLDWFNGVYLRKKTEAELLQLIGLFIPKGADENLVRQTIPLVKDRIVKLSDYSSLARFFFEEPELSGELFNTRAKEQLLAALEVFEEVETWDNETLGQAFTGLIQNRKWQTGDFFMNLRVAVSGSKVTPPITESIVILGKEKTLNRLNRVMEVL